MASIKTASLLALAFHRPSQGFLSSTNLGGRKVFCYVSFEEGKVSCLRTVSFKDAYVSRPQDLCKGCRVTHYAVQLRRPYFNLLWKWNTYQLLKYATVLEDTEKYEY